MLRIYLTSNNSNYNENQKPKSPMIKENNWIQNPKGYHTWSVTTIHQVEVVDSPWSTNLCLKQNSNQWKSKIKKLIEGSISNLNRTTQSKLFYTHDLADYVWWMSIEVSTRALTHMLSGFSFSFFFILKVNNFHS